jgi:hypothetical protein
MIENYFNLINFILIYKGAYDYFQGKRKYAEETFEIYKDPQNHLLTFKAEVSGRAPNGEFLIINVIYSITERFSPIAVQVKKTMGKQTTTEEYLFDHTTNTMRYHFQSDKMLGEINLATKQRMHISTPSISTSLLFLKSKKFQNSAVNTYKTLISDNQWDLNYNLRLEDISVERISSTPIDLSLKGQNIQAMVYRLSKFEYEDLSSKNQTKDKYYLELYLSKHLTVPYRIKDSTGDKILEMRYFNSLEKSEE